jgi:hypothetical protein
MLCKIKYNGMEFNVGIGCILFIVLWVAVHTDIRKLKCIERVYHESL